jgi:ABC-type uncharacterized transport system YnjBCD ATPase subunit
MGCVTCSAVVANSWDTGKLVISLLGPPGIGKTSLVEWLAGELVSFLSNPSEQATHPSERVVL